MFSTGPWRECIAKRREPRQDKQTIYNACTCDANPIKLQLQMPITCCRPDGDHLMHPGEEVNISGIKNCRPSAYPIQSQTTRLNGAPNLSWATCPNLLLSGVKVYDR